MRGPEHGPARGFGGWVRRVPRRGPGRQPAGHGTAREDSCDAKTKQGHRHGRLSVLKFAGSKIKRRQGSRRDVEMPLRLWTRDLVRRNVSLVTVPRAALAYRHITEE